MWYVCDVLYAVLHVCICCFVVRGCAVSRRYIDVCYCDMLSVVNVYLDHLKFCVVCINGRRYACCGECCVEVMYFGCFDFRGELGFLNCDDICMCVVNNPFELLEFVFDSFMLTCSIMRFLSLLLLGLCTCVWFVFRW